MAHDIDSAPKTHAEWMKYEPSVWDLLHIQEFFDECAAAKAGIERARVIEETDTKNERALVPAPVETELDIEESAGAAFLSWDAPACALSEAFSAVAA